MTADRNGGPTPYNKHVVAFNTEWLLNSNSTQKIRAIRGFTTAPPLIFRCGQGDRIKLN